MLKIPDFQRQFIWERNQVLDLLDSIYHHYPVGSFLLWLTDEEICTYRNIGNIELVPAPEGPIYYVLDGQQRITSLYASINDAEIRIKINGKQYKKKLSIYFDLEQEKFVVPDERQKPDKYYSLWQFPFPSDHVDNIAKTLEEARNVRHTRDSMRTWFASEFGTSNVSAKYAIRLMQLLGLVNYKEGVVMLSDDAYSFLETKSPSSMFKVFLKNIALFKESVQYVIKQLDVTSKDLNAHLNTEYDVNWKTTDAANQRIKWLSILGYGVYSNSRISLDKGTAEEIQVILSEVSGNDDEYDRKNLFPIRDIMDSGKMYKLAKLMSDEKFGRLLKVKDRFDAYNFSIIVIKNQPIDVVCNIFERINNSGTVLNLVDLMVAKTWSGDFNLKTYLTYFQEDLKAARFPDIPDILLLQSLSLNVQHNCRRKDILALDRDTIKAAWRNNCESVRMAIDFVKRNIKIATSKLLPYNSVLIPLAYFYYHNGLKEETFEQRNRLMDLFWRASVSNRYDSGAETKLADDAKYVAKVVRGEQAVLDYPLPSLTRQNIIDQNVSLGSAFSKMLLCLYASNSPKNIDTNSPIAFDSFSSYNSVEFHHVFPKNYLKRHMEGQYHLRDSIVNILFVSSGKNKEISDNPPGTYLRDTTNPRLSESLKSHFIYDIGESGLLENDFGRFLEYRAQNVLDRLNEVIGFRADVDDRSDEERGIDRFEMNMRRMIHEVLSAKDERYAETLLPTPAQEKISGSIDLFVSKHPHFDRKTLAPLDFLQIFDYYKIIRHNWPLFEGHFGSKNELETNIGYINEYRNCIKHQKPYDLATKKHAEAALLWFDSIFKKFSPNP